MSLIQFQQDLITVDKLLANMQMKARTHRHSLRHTHTHTHTHTNARGAAPIMQTSKMFAPQSHTGTT